jgi:pSer/pThr/pTyr-binding forkhead associated (FHA) protein
MAEKRRAPTTLPTTAQVVMRPRPPARLWSIRPRVGEAHPIGDRLFIGRDPGRSPALRISDPTVSREHVSISWSECAQSFVAEDHGSENGTRLSGEALRGRLRILSDGAVLRAGDAVFVVEVGEGAEAGDETPAIPGRSATIARVRREVERAAPEPAPVLLIGETGTGKELIAREIHRRSGRNGALVTVNCAELERELAESQLFGHGRGAFTGAAEPSPGLFRAADGGASSSTRWAIFRNPFSPNSCERCRSVRFAPSVTPARSPST